MSLREQLLPHVRPVELLDGELVDKYAQSIHVKADAIAADAWQVLVDATQSDYRERGIVVGRRGKEAETVRSEVFEGWGESSPEDDPDDPIPASSLSVPMFPFGIMKGLSQRIKKSALIHTHPMQPGLDHVRTTRISDEDIAQFTRSRYNALVMLDRGGAHLLARTLSLSLPDDFPPRDLVDAATREVIAGSGGSMDLLSRIAAGLSRYGLGYYYTPHLSGHGDTVGFQNMRVPIAER